MGERANATKWLNKIAQGFFSPWVIAQKRIALKGRPNEDRVSHFVATAVPPRPSIQRIARSRIRRVAVSPARPIAVSPIRAPHAAAAT